MRGYTHLVIMTNKDIYRIDAATYRELLGRLSQLTQPATYSFTDAQTNAVITVALSHVSSLSRRAK